ncbi:MAG: CBS domain-containing protein [Thermoplasmata archaeon]
MNHDLPNLYELDLPIRKFVTKRLIGIDSNSTVKEAAQKMVEFNISSLAVIEDEEVIGYFTDGDIKRKVVAKGRTPDMPVTEIMNEELITADITAKIRDVLELMSKQNIKHILVEERGKIIGIMTLGDLLDLQRHSMETHISRE